MGGGKAGAAAASSSFSSRFVPVSFLCLGPAEQAGRAPLAPGGGGAGMGWCRRRPGEGGKEGGREPPRRSPGGPRFFFLPARDGNSRGRAPA